MRIWSLHPRYLDAAGLVALWRETLLAQKVLQGLTKGYTNHPQLDRFRATSDPMASIGAYLTGVLAEAVARGYNFDRTKIVRTSSEGAFADITVTTGQLAYELEWLQSKLEVRSPKTLESTVWAQPGHGGTEILPHPLFTAVSGGVEPWERIR